LRSSAHRGTFDLMTDMATLPPPPVGVPGIPPDNAERSRRAAELHGIEWKPGMKPNRIGGPLWRPPRAPEEYPRIDPTRVCRLCSWEHVTLSGHMSCSEHVLGETAKLPCRGAPMVGTLCKSHTPDAGKRLAGKRAQRSLAKVHVTPIGDPLDELQKLASEALALKDHFASVVAELRHVGGAEETNARDQHGYRFTDDKGSEQLDARVALYERALDRSEKFLTNLVKIGFEEKRIRLDEARVVLMLDFTRELVRGLGHDLEDPAVELLVRSLTPILDGQPARIPAIEATSEEMST
jgi:hypothetical protein